MSVPPQQEHLLRRPRLLISDVPLLDLPQLALLHHLLRELQHLPDGHPGEDLLKGGGDEHVVGGDERDVQHAALCDQPVVTEQDAEPPAFVFRFHGGQAVQQVVVAFDGGQGGRLHGDPGDGVFADPLQLQVLVDGDALEHHHVEARLDAPVGEEAKVAGACRKPEPNRSGRLAARRACLFDHLPHALPRERQLDARPRSGEKQSV
mmetsp:Transcript_34639/g.58210  ORF Transcript_34639/g.58210 Transcript_34639/m.58210 type:complete len:206 (-) Transcript_34639:588-1205(-)